MQIFFRYFKDSLIVTAIGLVIGFWLGWQAGGTHGVSHLETALGAVFICAVLGVLEISLSFDNAVVNAKVLNGMTPLWQHRFLTWGILIAVVGMRLIFPLLIVGIVAHVTPWDAVILAAREPETYASLMQSAQTPVAAFGGAFLLLVALKYFLDAYKQTHWIPWLERPAAYLGRLAGIPLAIALLVLYFFSLAVPIEEVRGFLTAGIFGIITFIAVDGISDFLEDELPKDGSTRPAITDLHRASAGLFIYLEVLDASFSFDGVIGAFAITNNLFLITIGLGIGAIFVRSLTLLMVDRGTLAEYRYLEHGAFYAIMALAIIMFLSPIWDVPEVLTGFIGAGLIALALINSIWHKRQHRGSGMPA